MRSPLLFIPFFWGAMWGTGCANDTSEAAATTGSSTSSSSSTTAASTSSTSTGAATDASSTGTPGPRICKRECQAAFDCCPAGAVNCPNPDYPGNYACVDDICVPPSCTQDAECDAETPGASCALVAGAAQCVVLCSPEDDQCSGGESCSAMTDEGAAYCHQGCQGGAIDCGSGTCDAVTGLCLCDGQCIVGFACVPLAN